MIKSQIKFGLLVSSLSLCILSSHSKANSNIPDDNLFCPHSLATQAKIMYDYDQNEFTAVLDGKTKKINKYDVSGIPSNLSKDQMESFLKIGYFSLNKVGDDYSLKAGSRLRGGMLGKRSNYPGADKEKAAIATGGVITGAITGACLAGPPGAAVGAAVGGVCTWIGTEAADRQGNASNSGKGKK